MTDDWIEIGKIGIDAGLVWIGDPCYLRADAHNNPLADWGEFCQWLDPDNPLRVKAHGMLGVASSTGYGDGLYPVLARLSPDRRVAELRVVFIPDDDENQ